MDAAKQLIVDDKVKDNTPTQLMQVLETFMDSGFPEYLTDGTPLDYAKLASDLETLIDSLVSAGRRRLLPQDVQTFIDALKPIVMECVNDNATCETSLKNAIVLTINTVWEKFATAVGVPDYIIPIVKQISQFLVSFADCTCNKTFLKPLLATGWWWVSSLLLCRPARWTSRLLQPRV